jgi:hypothetical protein
VQNPTALREARKKVARHGSGSHQQSNLELKANQRRGERRQQQRNHKSTNGLRWPKQGPPINESSVAVDGPCIGLAQEELRDDR